MSFVLRMSGLTTALRETPLLAYERCTVFGKSSFSRIVAELVKRILDDAALVLDFLPHLAEADRGSDWTRVMRQAFSWDSWPIGTRALPNADAGPIRAPLLF
ncbi:hypothetical protein ANAPRD1_01263 [Anaplasma phagocytophilum]|nr:hypothetical protein ANAPRD1_01263 [Anaplasma phagocytophilum]